MMKPKAGINQIELLLEDLTVSDSNPSDIIDLIDKFDFTKSTLELALYNIAQNPYYKNDFEKLINIKILLIEQIITMNNSILSKL